MSDLETGELVDHEQAKFNYGKGGVPWYLMVFYLAFCTFFTWYVLEFQLQGFINESPLGETPGVEAPAE
ncbi:MAG: hypothetical protein ACI8TQ_000348 [Planctomycetota bacterium]|jgi:hypothetical protein